MNERVRMQYLEALGVPVYVPRLVLPNAKPSPRALLPAALPGAVEETGHAGRAPPRRAAAVPEVASAPQGIGTLMQALKPAVSRPASAPAPATAASPAAEEIEAKLAGTGREVRFSLHFWQVSADTLVMDSHHPRAALPVAVLLANMLFAVGESGQIDRPELLTWPLLPQLPSAPLLHARDMVSAFLAGRTQGAPVSRVWLMGEQAYLACVDGSEDYATALGQVRPVKGLASSALILPSLAEMLQRPAVKRVAWRALKHYYGLA